MGEIGIRAAEAIRAMAKENETTLTFEMECMGMHFSQLYQFDHFIADPGATTLANMAKNGYDIYYILTGERK